MAPIKPPAGDRAAFPWNRKTTDNGLQFGENSEVRRWIKQQQRREAVEASKHKSRRRGGFK